MIENAEVLSGMISGTNYLDVEEEVLDRVRMGWNLEMDSCFQIGRIAVALILTYIDLLPLPEEVGCKLVIELEPPSAVDDGDDEFVGRNRGDIEVCALFHDDSYSQP